MFALSQATNIASTSRAREYSQPAGAVIFFLLIVSARAALALNAPLRAGDILVTDRSASDGVGAVIRIDPKTGAQSSISSGGLLSQVGRITIDGKGRILVTLRVGEGTHRQAGIASINP